MRPRYFAGILCAVLLFAACTAGCTSPLSSSPNAQTSPVGKSQMPGYPPDNPGSDPDPSLVPRYQPSVRIVSPENGSAAGWTYETKSALSNVRSFYNTQMAKLGYTIVAGTENSTENSWSVKYGKHNTTTILMRAARTPPSPIWAGYLPQPTDVTYFSFAPVNPGEEGP